MPGGSAVPAVVMTIAKITAGDGYTYLTRHVAHADAEGGMRDATAYYTAQGNPPGLWTGRGAPLLGIAGTEVTEEQMRLLFGTGEHPGADAMIAAHIRANFRPGMTERQVEKLRAEAARQGRLGRPFPSYEALERFDDRVAARLGLIRQEAGREPTQAEEAKVRAQEARRSRAAVAGFDLVFSPVKSAALLWALDPRPHVREAVREAHEQAMREALDLVEEHAAFTRTGAGGIAQVETGGLTAAAFEHWDSRAGDPNLHTHVAVSAKVRAADGKWRALDARALYRITVAASELYNTAFEARLTAALGVSFTPRPDTASGREPVREITGVPPAVTGFFSRRRAAIEARYAQLAREYRGRHGHDPPAGACHRLARQANLDTRQGKQPPRSLRDKRAAWRAELTARFGSRALAQLMTAVPSCPPPRPAQGVPSPPDLHEVAERVVATVAARRSTWTVWNLRAEAERILRTDYPPLPPEAHRDVARQVTELATSPACSISTEAPALLDEPPELRRSDGEPVFGDHASGRYTSRQVLDAERRLAEATATPTAFGIAAPAAATALDGFEAHAGTRLDAGQRNLVTAFASDDRLLLAGIGPAGAGKTTAMRALAQVLRQGGHRLIPLATSAAAAGVLGGELGVRAENLHKFLHEWTAGPAAARLQTGARVPAPARWFQLGPGDVVLVDEAGMAGTFLLDALVTIAASRGAVVRLLGDDRQLSAVESGGALRLVAAAPGTPCLTVLHRFRDPAEAAATLQVRAGDGTAIDWYTAAGRVRGGSREAMAQAAYDGWKADMLAGKVTLMAAGDGRAVTELAGRARADRVAAGQVEAAGVLLRDGNLAGAGDWIVTRRNDRRMSLHGGRDWVKNGDAWRVLRRHSDGSLTVAHTVHDGRVRLPADYVQANVQLLYATTAHRAQGVTVDTAHPLITTGMTREVLYVLSSRARERTTLYVATHDLPFDEDARTDQARHDPRAYAAREILLNIIATEGAALSATETITTAQEQAGSLATLVPRYLHAAREHADARYRAAAAQTLGDTADDVIADPAWHAVAARLHTAEGNGWNPTRLLTRARNMRELDSAESIAEVLTWRIDAVLADTPQPPPPGRDSETAPATRARLTQTAVAVLGPRLGTRAQHETAWPALIGTLRRAEHQGQDPAGLLGSAVSARELRTARSVSEVLTWRLAARLAQPPVPAEPSATVPPDAPEPGLLPWLPSPAAARERDPADGIAGYLREAAGLISARVSDLIERAVRERPAWMAVLGSQPPGPEDARQWRRHIAVVAAYRDQYQVTTDDPRQVLGPYAEPGHAGHTAYWHATESVLAARRLAGLDTGPAQTDQARVLAAADIYHALPATERTQIAAAIAVRHRGLWLGNRTSPDEHAAAHPAYAAGLLAILAERGHITSTTELGPREHRATPANEPLEAGFARRKARQRATTTPPAPSRAQPAPAPKMPAASKQPTSMPQATPHVPAAPVPKMT